MKEIVLATYERESTLWKNANIFYKAQDWVKMECLFVDYSDNRGFARVIDNTTGEDITDSHFADRYVIRLTNKRGSRTKSFEFATREEANRAFSDIFHHKNLPGWRKVTGRA